MLPLVNQETEILVPVLSGRKLNMHASKSQNAPVSHTQELLEGNRSEIMYASEFYMQSLSPKKKRPLS